MREECANTDLAALALVRQQCTALQATATAGDCSSQLDWWLTSPSRAVRGDSPPQGSFRHARRFDIHTRPRGHEDPMGILMADWLPLPAPEINSELDACTIDGGSISRRRDRARGLNRTSVRFHRQSRKICTSSRVGVTSEKRLASDSLLWGGWREEGRASISRDFVSELV